MSYDQKLECAVKELEASPLWEVGQRPLGFRILRRIGVKVVPPYYRPFRVNFLLHSLWIGGSFLVLNVPVGEFVREYGDWAERGANGLCGVGIALMGALSYRSNALKNGLSSWEDLGAESGSADSVA